MPARPASTVFKLVSKYYNYHHGGQLLDFPFPQVPQPSRGSGTVPFIQDNIILIPRNSSDNQHLTYASVCGEEKFSGHDEFSDLLRQIEDSSTARTEEETAAKPKGRDNSVKTSAAGKVEGARGSSYVKSSEYIPCLFLSGSRDKLILFFHANGEDITSAY